ncbi:MAG TPA: tetratricopeptide repeat protein [Rhizomicrobium sp.]|nr:tetratricopeptide repeat protein [Rhizomicrobium sp.]
MARLLLGCLISLILSVSGAWAAGYDDFASGLSAINRGDDDQAITFFTSALAAGDLNARLVPIAYLDRGRAHWRKGKCTLAIADFSAAIKARPDYFDAYVGRGIADRCAGNDADAIIDFTQAVAKRPFADAYWQRGLARWDLGDLDGAAQDFSATVPLAPTWPYPALWFAMSKQRTGSFDGRDFASRIDGLDLHEWPGPALELFRGNATPDDVYRAAGEGDAKKTKGQLCEADFYVAEWWIVQKKPDAAKPLLMRARDNCPQDFTEYVAAAVELKRLP